MEGGCGLVQTDKPGLCPVLVETAPSGSQAENSTAGALGATPPEAKQTNNNYWRGCPLPGEGRAAGRVGGFVSYSLLTITISVWMSIRLSSPRLVATKPELAEPLDAQVGECRKIGHADAGIDEADSRGGEQHKRIAHLAQVEAGQCAHCTRTCA